MLDADAAQETSELRCVWCNELLYVSSPGTDTRANVGSVRPPPSEIAPVETITSATQAWEYRIVRQSSWLDEQVANRLGATGWELVSVVAGVASGREECVAYFKRPRVR